MEHLNRHQLEERAYQILTDWEDGDQQQRAWDVIEVEAMADQRGLRARWEAAVEWGGEEAIREMLTHVYTRTLEGM